MYEGKIIDTHAHIYPDKIAAKAVRNISGFYDLTAYSDGSIRSLAESGSQIGVRAFVVHSTATKREQVQSINNFIIEAVRENPSFVGYATLHFDMTRSEIEQEVKRFTDEGLRGVKLHPDFQKFYIDDSCMFDIYDICQEAGLPILIHTGDPRYETSRPQRLAKMAKAYPKLIFIGAHFGGYGRWEEVECYKDTSNVYFDTSSSLFIMQKKEPERIIEMLSSDRFFFATDYPLFTHAHELKRFMKLDLSEDVREKILYKNAERVLKI